jgi:hypothetical protein
MEQTASENTTEVHYLPNGDIDYAISIERGTGYLGKPCLVQVKRTPFFDECGNLERIAVQKTPISRPLTSTELATLRVDSRLWREQELH